MAEPIDPRVDIGHVHLKVADLDRSLAFYSGVLGFELTARLGPSAAFLSAGGYHHHIGLNTWESRNGPAPAPGTTGLYHAAIRYPDRAALAEALRRLVGPRRQRGAVSARSGRQRPRAVLGSSEGAVAARCGRLDPDDDRAARRR